MRELMIAAAVAVAAAGASGDVLFDNFGPGDSYALDTGWAISHGAILAGAVYEQAVAFTVTGGDYYFDSADLAVFNTIGPDLVHLDLRADAGGNVGEVLESTTASGVIPWFVHAEPMTATFSGTTVLREGETYWLSLRTEETDAVGAWASNIIGDYGLHAFQLNGEGWNPSYGDPTDQFTQRAVFRINGTAVPAPGTGVLALLAGGTVCRRRRA